MDRREFLLNTAKAAGVTLPWWGLLPLSANAQTPASKIVVYYHFDGGLTWDFWTDPSVDPRYNLYTQQGLAIPRIGNLAVAPMGNNAAFFTRFRDQCLVLNGSNTQTNSHEDGQRVQETGKLAMGFAPLCELHAAKVAAGMPAGWLLRDGGTVSAGLYPATAIPDQNQLRAMIDPLAVNGTNDYVKRADFSKTVEARAARLEALKANGVMLPKERLITDAFIAGKEARVRLAAVANNIPVNFGQFPDLEVSLICAQSGITAAIQTSSGGFDTHGDVNGNNQSLTNATNRLTYLWDEAARRGIADRLFVVAAGEFSRTELNGSNGNDHDSVGAGCLIMGPPGWGLGNRVVGYTGPNHTSRAINPKTGAPDPNGVMITSAHMQDALRTYLGATPTNPTQGLGVPANEKLDLFNPAMSTGYPTLPA